MRSSFRHRRAEECLSFILLLCGIKVHFSGIKRSELSESFTVGGNICNVGNPTNGCVFVCVSVCARLVVTGRGNMSTVLLALSPALLSPSQAFHNHSWLLRNVEVFHFKSIIIVLQFTCCIKDCSWRELSTWRQGKVSNRKGEKWLA